MCEAFEYCTGGWTGLRLWYFHSGTDVFGGRLLSALCQGTHVSEKPWLCSLCLLCCGNKLPAVEKESQTPLSTLDDWNEGQEQVEVTYVSCECSLGH